MGKIAIMQPTYLPWLGYFSLIKCVDVFVLLDDVQFEKRSWQQRNKILLNQKEFMLSLSVLVKGKRNQKISEVILNENEASNIKHLNTIKHSYCNAGFFKDYFDDIKDIYLENNKYLLDLIINLIEYQKKIFEIKTQILRSSELNCSGRKDEYLFNICEEIGIKNYIAVEGSRNYLQNSNLFNQKNINYFSFNHPAYLQNSKQFIPYLAAIDSIFHIGPDAATLLDDYQIQ